MSKVHVSARDGYIYIQPASKESTKLNQAEVEDLITDLLATQMHFPEIVQALWTIRTAPHGELVLYYSHNKGQVVKHLYRCYVYLGQNQLLVSAPFEDGKEAISNAWDKYGAQFPVYDKIVEDLVSKEQADHEATMYLAAEYCKSKGISLKQLMVSLKEK